MTTIKVSESIIKEKARFLEANAAKFFLARNDRINGSKNTMGEMLLGVLITDKPLRMCSSYEELQCNLSEIQYRVPESQTENYPLQVIFSLVNYVNSAYSSEEQTVLVLKDKLRRYIKHLNNRMVNNNVVFIDQDNVQTEQPKKYYK